MTSNRKFEITDFKPRVFDTMCLYLVNQQMVVRWVPTRPPDAIALITFVSGLNT